MMLLPRAAAYSQSVAAGRAAGTKPLALLLGRQQPSAVACRRSSAAGAALLASSILRRPHGLSQLQRPFFLRSLTAAAPASSHAAAADDAPSPLPPPPPSSPAPRGDQAGAAAGPQPAEGSTVAAFAAAAGAAAADGGRDAEQPEPPLDWKVGVTLAGVSFEAYCELQEKGLPERHPCGAEIYYLDREFVRDNLAGLLQVTVRRAHSPPAAEAGGPLSSSPQLQLSVGDCTWTSTAALNNPDPEYEESCTLYVRSPEKQALRLLVPQGSGQPQASGAGSLGCASLALGPLCDGQQHEVEVRLLCSKEEACSEDGDSANDSSSSSSSSSVSQRAGEGSTGGGTGEGSSSSGGGGGGSSGRGASPGGQNQLVGEPCGSVQLSCRFLSIADYAAQGTAAHSEMGSQVVGTPGRIPLAEDWRELLELAGVQAHAMFRPAAFIENATTNTQAWLYWNPEQRTACVAFRGTEQGKWRDILTDLHLVPAPLDPDRVAEAPREAALAEVSQPPEESGGLSQILSSVEQAKDQVAVERQQQAEEHSSREQAEQHILATAVSTVRSAAEDLTAVLERVMAEIEAAERREREGREREGEEPQPWVHSGFLLAYDSVRPAVLSLLDALLDSEHDHEQGQGQGPAAGGVAEEVVDEKLKEPRNSGSGGGGNSVGSEQAGPWRVYFAGHSLGGALAELCAWDCAHRRWLRAPELEVWNYGTPRVGNRAFAQHFNRLVPSTWRVVNARDTVCTIPRLMGYAHVGHAIYLLEDGSTDVVMHSTERLGEGLSLPDVAPAVTAAVVAKVPELLPEVATEALQRLGIEVASSGDQAAVEAQAAELAGMGRDSSGEEEQVVGGDGGAAGIGPHQLPQLWREEQEAWRMLLGGAALDEHMEPQYLNSLKLFLARKAEEGGSEEERAC